MVKTLADVIRQKMEATAEEEEAWKERTQRASQMLDRAERADAQQAGGDHYKSLAIQPWHLMEDLLTREEFIGFLKGNMIKYAMRQGRKDSPDHEKYLHYKQKLNEIVSR